jgi:Domain of unknown function (DUF4397)
MRMRARTILPVALLAVLCGWSVPASATAAPAAPQDVASIRAADLSPGTTGLDVSLTSFAGNKVSLRVTNASYAVVSRYASVSAGLYLVAIRLHGSGPASAPRLTWNLDARPGNAYTVAVVGSGVGMHGVALHDDLTAPRTGFGRVRVIQAASMAAAADVRLVKGPALATNLPFTSSSGYTQVHAGTWQLIAHSIGERPVSADATLSVTAGTVTSILLLDAPNGGLTLRTVLDAESARPARGAVPAGGGGMASVISAPPAHDQPWIARPVTIAAGVGLVGLVVLIAAVRRRRTVG